MSTRYAAFRYPPEYSPYIENLLCYDGKMRVRPKVYRRNHTMGSGAVKSLFTFVTDAGAEKLIACTNSKIYNCSSSGAGVDLTGLLTVTTDEWQGFTFNNRLFLLNGTDPVVVIDSTVTAAAAAFTGPSGSDTALIQGCNYRGRPYMVEKDSLSYWYHRTIGGVTGALTEVDLARVVQFGGKLMFCASATSNQGATANEFMVFVTDQGEVLMYSGDYPDASNWNLFARTRIAQPLSRRSYVHLGGELMLLTRAGMAPISQIISSPSVSQTLYSVTQEIEGEFKDITRAFSGSASTNYKYCAVHNVQDGYLLVNFHNTATYAGPNTEGTGYQLVQVLDGGAWSYLNHIDAASWTFFDNKLHFGTSAGTVGYLENTYVGENYDQNTATGVSGAAGILYSVTFPWTNCGYPGMKHMHEIVLTGQCDEYEFQILDAQLNYPSAGRGAGEGPSIGAWYTDNESYFLNYMFQARLQFGATDRWFQLSLSDEEEQSDGTVKTEFYAIQYNFSPGGLS
jgi:hypothetical protein